MATWIPLVDSSQESQNRVKRLILDIATGQTNTEDFDGNGMFLSGVRITGGIPAGNLDLYQVINGVALPVYDSAGTQRRLAISAATNKAWQFDPLLHGVINGARFTLSAAATAQVIITLDFVRISGRL